MRAGWILIPLALAGAAALAAVPLPELFQKVKLRVSAGDFAGGLEALKELEAEAARPENEGARGALRPAAAFYRGVCFASLGKNAEARAEFGVFQSANPDKTIVGPAARGRRGLLVFLRRSLLLLPILLSRLS